MVWKFHPLSGPLLFHSSFSLSCALCTLFDIHVRRGTSTALLCKMQWQYKLKSTSIFYKLIWSSSHFGILSLIFFWHSFYYIHILSSFSTLPFAPASCMHYPCNNVQQQKVQSHWLLRRSLIAICGAFNAIFQHHRQFYHRIVVGVVCKPTIHRILFLPFATFQKMSGNTDIFVVRARFPLCPSHYFLLCIF